MFNKIEHEVIIGLEQVQLKAILAIPLKAKAMIVFAHGSGSGRLSPRNKFVSRVLQHASLGTLLLDLLTEQEEIDRRNVFDIQLLAERLVAVKNWIVKQGVSPEIKKLPIGYFGASTGAGAALVAAAKNPQNVFAIVSRGGRPDLAETHLSEVKAPTLLLVGGNDEGVIDLNKKALDALNCIKEMRIIPGATHLFEEPGTLEEVAYAASDWFIQYCVEKMQEKNDG
jgi:putative phosphoribosyl transferase